jgi:DNA helicase-2/ATP-dependent DNA helicase PcrA
MDLLIEISESRLFIIPSELKLSIERTKSYGAEEELKDDDENLLAWDQALQSKFNEIIKYNGYVSDSSNFGTHQGVKGLEFDRVVVIIDDEESKGFMFSYDKLFGLKELSKNDNRNIAEGKETGIDRTSRLFYVACSRAKESLAIVAYTDNGEQLKTNLIGLDWFNEDEVVIIK